MDVRIGNIYEVAEKVASLMEDLVFSGLAVLAVAGIFLLGFLAVQWIVSKICGN